MMDHLDAGRETVESKLRSRALVVLDTLFGNLPYDVHQVRPGLVVHVGDALELMIQAMLTRSVVALERSPK